MRKFFITISIFVLSVLLACAFGVSLILYASRPYIYTSLDSVPTTEAAIVLGASVTGSGQLSKILKERADEAALLYKAHKVSKILVTGDNSTVAHNEVDPTGKYLQSQEVAPQDIFLDHAGFDTYSSMYRAKEVFDVASVIIVSQAFHLPRAVYIARSMGLDAYGVDASSGGVDIHNYLREVPADVKAIFDVVLERVPKYLGTQYPITGDGRATWGYSVASSTDAIFPTTTIAQ